MKRVRNREKKRKNTFNFFEKNAKRAAKRDAKRGAKRSNTDAKRGAKRANTDSHRHVNREEGTQRNGKRGATKLKRNRLFCRREMDREEGKIRGKQEMKSLLCFRSAFPLVWGGSQQLFQIFLRVIRTFHTNWGVNSKKKGKGGRNLSKNLKRD